MEPTWEITLSLGRNIPGRELLKLLEKIHETGSLTQAVEAAGMSYRHAWGLLNRAEDALNKKLVTRKTGGSSGGGTLLTDEGLFLLGRLHKLQQEVHGQLRSMLEEQDSPGQTQIMLASTMEPVVTGLLDLLEQAYFRETGVAVRHVGAGSGQAIALAKAGRVEALLTHAPVLEEQFMQEGWGTKRLAVMSNDFVLVGPQDNPANLLPEDPINRVLQKIAEINTPFISRGDHSGTHLFELELWEKAGIAPRTESWYHEARSILGSYGALRRAAELKGYTIIDRASFITGNQDSEMIVLASGAPELKNIFSVMTVSRVKAAVNQEEAERFARWLVSPQAQKIIGEFGGPLYEGALFCPVQIN
ncbi:MAG: substrate-binding domain-containing protein [Bacillota bacterium]|nr:substrate-binding domain-containing protein [Bacillota bacterium]